MDEFSIEILASAAGVAAIVIAIIGLFRVLWPWGLSVSVLRIMSVVLGIGLATLASAALIGPAAPNGDVTLAAMGPLTNLALAVVEEPRIVPRIREIVLMGGGMGPGNATAAAEFNIHTDPHAAAVVFSAGAPLTMIGLDVTRRAVATAARVAAIRAIGTPAAEAVAGMLSLHLERAAGATGESGGLVHDACVTAYLLRPELFTVRPMAITVETADPETRGKTVVDAAGAPTNADVVLGIDADGFFALLTERLAALR